MRLGELSLGHAEDGSLTNLTLAGRAVEVAPEGELWPCKHVVLFLRASDALEYELPVV